VQGAGIHHNPTPGPAGEKFVYGQVWVCLAWLARNPVCDTLALPLRALFYVRAKDVPTLAKNHLELPKQAPTRGGVSALDDGVAC
jgi:hypothetical protein